MIFFPLCSDERATVIDMCLNNSKMSVFYEKYQDNFFDCLDRECKGVMRLDQYSSINSRCNLNSVINKNGIYKQFNLKFKIGVLVAKGPLDMVIVNRQKLMAGFGCGDFSDGFLTDRDYYNGMYHCWLENDSGNVFDHVQDVWYDANISDKNTPFFPKNKRFVNMPKSELAQIGMEYFAYNDKICERFYKKTIDDFKL